MEQREELIEDLIALKDAVEEEEVCSVLEDVRGPLTRHPGARSSPPERPRSRSNIT